MSDHRMFKVGDIVTRDGSDRQRVLAINDARDLVTVECIVEPLGDLEEGGTSRGEPWIRFGEREDNLARRYSYPTEPIDAERAGETALRAIDRALALLDMILPPGECYVGRIIH